MSFDGFPQFFLAHEIAHQFWGNAVGWENYHEQWISEGFAQYFALLYAERTRSREDFEDILRQLRRTAAANTRNGPVWLGYRLGHLQGDGRIFRALVYNKGALVLHMLRRLLGDDAFFRGPAPVLSRLAVHEGRHRRRAARVRGGVGPAARPLLRAAGSSAHPTVARRCPGG